MRVSPYVITGNGIEAGEAIFNCQPPRGKRLFVAAASEMW
jgi:hypothetical protein